MISGDMHEVMGLPANVGSKTTQGYVAKCWVYGGIRAGETSVTCMREGITSN